MKLSTSIRLLAAGILLAALGLGIRRVRIGTAPEQVRKALEARFHRSVDGEISVESARFEFDGTVEARNLVVSASGAAEPFVESPRIIARLDPWQLLHLRKVPRRCTVLSPTVRLLCDPERETWNLPAIKPQEQAGTAPEALLADGVRIEDATVKLRGARLFGDTAVRAYRGVHLQLTRASAVGSRWHFTGRVGRGQVRGLRLRGDFDDGSSIPLQVTFDAPGLRGERTLWRQIPHGQFIWQEYRPVGDLAASGVISLHADGKVAYRCQVQMHGVEATAHFLPARVRSVRGTVVVSQEGVALRNLTGIIPAVELDPQIEVPFPVHVSGSGTHRRRGGSDYRVELADMPLCRRSLETIPGAGARIWERLRPRGLCDVSLRLSSEDEEGPLRSVATVRVRDVTVHPAELPRPLRNLSGTIQVDRDVTTLRGVRCELPPPQGESGPAGGASVFLDGHVAREGGAVRLDVRFSNLTTDKQLLQSILGRGGQLWEDMRPVVTLDGRLRLERERNDAPLSCSGVLNVHGGRALLRAFPVPLEGVRGTIRVSGSDVFLERLSATLRLPAGPDGESGANQVEVSGPLNLEDGRAELSLTARNMNVGEELLKAIPAIGEQMWAEARPAGLGSVRGRITYDATQDNPLDCLLETEFFRIDLQPRRHLVPITALSGRAVISDTMAVSDDFTAITCAGQINGSLVARYGTSGEYPTYAATVRLRQIDLAQLLREVRGSEPNVSGLLSGSADLGGVLGSRTSLTAEGTLSLREASLWEMPFFSRLINVLHLNLPGTQKGTKGTQEGEARFRYMAGDIEVDRFEITGGGLNITGHGTISRDEELDMVLVVVGTESRGKGIPVISALVGWAMRAAEGELFRVKVSGTIDEPKYSHEFLGYIAWPLTSVRNVLRDLIYGGAEEPG